MSSWLNGLLNSDTYLYLQFRFSNLKSRYCTLRVINTILLFGYTLTILFCLAIIKLWIRNYDFYMGCHEEYQCKRNNAVILMYFSVGGFKNRSDRQLPNHTRLEAGDQLSFRSTSGFIFCQI